MPDFYAEDLAYCHHVGFANPQLPGAVVAALQKKQVRDGCVVDLGCNGGHLLAALSQAGFDPVGVDLSAPALQLAAVTAPQALLVQGDIATYPLPNCSAVTAMGEVFCYTPTDGADALSRPAFAPSIFDALRPGGVLIFDIVIRDDAHPFHYRRRHEGHDWVIDHAVSEDLSSHRLRRRIALDRCVDGIWRRSRETHFLHIHDRDDIARQLRGVGFDVEMSTRIGEVEMLPRRAAFICRKPTC